MAAAAVLLVVSACGTQKAGSAAIADDQRLTQSQVSDQVQEMSDLYASNPDADPLTNEQLTQAAISWWLNDKVLDAYAEAEDITVTEAQVDQVLGPADQRDQLSLRTGVAPSQLEDAARAVVAYQAAAQALVAEGLSEQEAVGALSDQLAQTADELGVKVNPRYGSGWVPGLEQVLEPRNPERLSSPAEASASPTPEPTLEP
jgi:hypothetical protein